MIPGIPDIPGFKGLATSGIDALIGFGGAYAINRIFGNQWGVYNQFGIPILLADTFHSMKCQNTSQVSQAPVERGTFTSYNKVQDPYKATVTLIKGGGNQTERGAFIAQLEALSKSTLLFHVVTPEYVHRNAAIVGYDFAREPGGGARMVVANLHLQEVRESKVQYETVEPKNPEDASTVESGEQQVEQVPDSVLLRVVKSDAVREGVQTVLDLAEDAYDRFGRGLIAQ